MQVALVNEALRFMKQAWRSEAAARLLQEHNIHVDPVWAASCSCQLYYRQALELLACLPACLPGWQQGWR